ncbi:riboflavin synthase [Texcoconibacillus texcoconensis]|uniref:Riboflavin synthase n=1 Tax=Texcoconibacillus texcoconensis TaxID=1095777 RepID=A0A840QNR0_9BACI|nr:riboflavin synthase [Texcoconibacillus texcoconensis]MBB5172973.1 riboflavin synthase [Texcoconibacillus texcoconensis]
MFTGIVEEKGTIRSMRQTGESIVMSVEAAIVLEDVSIGDSIAVNGVCLTVTAYDARSFSVDVMPETVRHTSLNDLRRGSEVNLERAMSAAGRFGGHFVSGHIDGTGKIRSKERQDNAVYYEIAVDPSLRKYMLMKGSVAVDGTSLTIFGLTDDSITISIIPHTLDETVIGSKGVGDIVNIECDMLGKYVDQFMQTYMSQPPSNQGHSLTESFLRDNGF